MNFKGYDFYKYTGNKRLITKANPEYDLLLIEGSVFAVKGNVVIHTANPDIKFKLVSTLHNLLRLSTPISTTKGMLTLDVDSSALLSVRYNQDTETLFVVFKNGAPWAYHNVTLDEYQALCDADSKGSHFYHYIRDVKEATRL